MTRQLAPLNTLAVGLIALTAGGELKIAALRRGLGAILGVLGGQLFFVLLIIGAFGVAISGVVPRMALPGLGELDLSAVLALSAVLGCVSVATSPSATIAVINDLRARGPVTSTVLATVVFKDVIVVVLFAVVTTIAAQAMGLGGGEDQALGLYLLKHIGGALVLGAVVGFGMALYLRFVKAEVLLFTVGGVFTAAYIASALQIEMVVLFIAAGFVAANFERGRRAPRHRRDVVSARLRRVLHARGRAPRRPVPLRHLALRRGLRAPARPRHVPRRRGRRPHRGAPAAVRKHGWLGFVSQAGVSISLANIIAANFEGPGRAISSLIIAGIAVNELAGPVLLKLGLGGAGEIGAARREEAEPEAAPAPSTETAAPAEKDELAPWPAPERGADAWGAPLSSSAPELDGAVRDLTFDLAQLAREVADEPLARFREDALSFVRDLRREFLRHHRRITVHATSEDAELEAAEALRLEQAELAEKWRAAVLARAARVKQLPTWDPRPILDAAEAITDTLPATVAGAYEEGSFAPREDDSSLVALGRWWLRVRRGARRVFGEGMPPRDVQLRALARYHFWGELPERLEPVAALYAQAESHLVARTRSIFDGLVVQYDALAGEVEAAQRAEAERAGKPKNGEDVAVGGEADPSAAMSAERLAERLREVRERVDEELMLAVQEVDRIADDVALRTSTALGVCLRALREDALKAGTPDLPMRKRAASALYRRRDEALRWLERGTAGARDTAAALYNRLALEMELIALEGRVKDALEEHATALGRDVRGRAHRQVERVHAAIAEAQEELTELLGGEHAPAELARAVRESCEPVMRVSAEAARVAALLRDQG
ncbi:MAG: cation:proton antiporter [Sandaracinaceae bacterium]|nr:cation:proton antiporter [Sandaracinaceae bacterium]